MTDGVRPLPALPRVGDVVDDERLADLVELHGRRSVTHAVRAVLDEVGERVRSGLAPSDDTVHVQVRDHLDQRDAAALRRVINATGVVLHTHLGRAPLSAAARAAVLDAAGYSTLEYDLTTGGRASRTAHLGDLAADLCGTEAATVVNNGAAALVLTLAALAAGREVIVSRGELVEIGGTYRLPETMAAAGVRTVEVGTTNHTRLDDYRAAVTDDTALLLKVNRSSYRVVGSTEEVSVTALAALGEDTRVPVVHDLGSGLLHDVHEGPLAEEPSVAGSVRSGADLVIVSGDKLLGGPQAGIVAGRSDLVMRCTRHPLARAVQVDKLQRAALEATFASHLRHDLPRDLPTIAMLELDPEQLRERAEWMAAELGPGATAVRTSSVVGGGTSSGVELHSWAVALEVADATSFAADLRGGDPPLVVRTDHDAVLLDLRTVPPSQDAEVADLVLAARA